MANLNLQIGGRSYTVACQDGEEAHIRALGQAIDDKLASLGPNAAQHESRGLLFAALLLADEAHELKNRAPVAAPPADSGASAAPGLEAIAARLEKLAESLEA